MTSYSLYFYISCVYCIYTQQDRENVEHNEIQSNPQHPIEVVSTAVTLLHSTVSYYVLYYLLIYALFYCCSRYVLFTRLFPNICAVYTAVECRIRGATFQRLAQSDRHIFVGTSAATVSYGSSYKTYYCIVCVV